MIVRKFENTLVTGDTVSCDITHEILVEGDRSWVKYGVVSAVQQDEDAETARDRVTRHVDEGVMAAVMRVVDTTRKATS